MVAAFQTPVDIANRALQHVGALRISAFSDNSKSAAESNFAYDKVRRAEMRRAVWKFSRRRCVMRPVTSTATYINPLLWLVGTTYAALAIVQDSAGAYWQSLQSSNTGNALVDGSAFWTRYFGILVGDAYSAGTTYYIGDIVTSAGHSYVSNANANIGNTPSGGSPWVDLGAATTSTIVQLAPAGYGPLTTSTVKGVFRLPYGFIRLAPQDAKFGSGQYLATSGGVRFNDWELHDKFLLTAQATPFFFQYVADISDVTGFDDLFCEAFAARMGMEICEPLTQSGEKMQLCAKLYAQYRSEAVSINAVELGTTEQDEMEYNPLLPANPTDQPQKPRGQ